MKKKIERDPLEGDAPEAKQGIENRARPLEGGSQPERSHHAQVMEDSRAAERLRERIENTRNSEDSAKIYAPLIFHDDLKGEIVIHPLRSEKVLTEGQVCTVYHVSVEALSPAWGMAYSLHDAEGHVTERIALIREDLPQPVMRFVQAHEIFHLTDTATWGGWIGREIRANFWPGLKDPVGFLASLIHNLKIERLRFYFERFKRGY